MRSSAVYPGTFDPFTRGHEDIVRRAATIFDHVVVAIAANPNKTPTFDSLQRVDLARNVLADLPNIEVVGYSGLTVDFARARNQIGRASCRERVKISVVAVLLKTNR